MTEDEGKKRARAIEKMQADMENRITALDRALFALLVENIDRLLENPEEVTKIIDTFRTTFFMPMLEQFTVDLFSVLDLNAEYFQGAVGTEVNAEVFQAVKSRISAFMEERLGVVMTGRTPQMKQDGFIRDLFDMSTPRMELRRVIFNAKQSGMGPKALKAMIETEVRGLIGPNGRSPGLMERYSQTYVYDTYQQADAVAQDTFASELGMQAAIYTGGLIRTSRPFCVVRNGKVFLRDEIMKFGTPQDQYGGYTDKSKGAFSGKNKGYNPLTDRGGYNCRHIYGYIRNAEALRRDNTLEEVDGKLKRKNQ